MWLSQYGTVLIAAMLMDISHFIENLLTQSLGHILKHKSPIFTKEFVLKETRIHLTCLEKNIHGYMAVYWALQEGNKMLKNMISHCVQELVV